MISLRWVVPAMLCTLASAPATMGAELEVGQKAPEFELSDHSGKVQKLSEYRGKRVVLAFYPSAGTPG